MRKITPTPFPVDPLVNDVAVLGAAVRAARTAANLRLVDAASLIGVARQTLNDLENGKPSVSFGNVLKIADGLGVALFCVPAAARERMRRRLTEPG